MHTTLTINAKKYETSKLLAAVLSGAVIDMPNEYIDNARTLTGQHHAFIQHEGQMVRVVIGAHATSRKARLISKIVLKKALVLPPAPPVAMPTQWQRPDDNRFVPRESQYDRPYRPR